MEEKFFLQPPEVQEPKIPIFKKWWFWALIIIIAIVIEGIIILKYDSPDTTSAEYVNYPTDNATPVPTIVPTEQPIKITVDELLKEYDDNAVAADQKYKGKNINITGIVGSIDKEMTNILYVSLKSELYQPTIICYFDINYEQELANLEKGTVVTIIGDCDGKMTNILLENCSFN